MDGKPFVSVIVPVFNDRVRLQRCLAALEGQSYPPGLFEVVVVDNGSAEPLADRMRVFSHARVVSEPRPGSYAARNTGIRLARGAVLAFTDSDCVPMPDWIEAAAARLAALPQPGIIAGRIDRSLGSASRPTLAAIYDSSLFMRQESYVREGGFGITANLVTGAEAFVRAGLFDPKLKSGGDMDWSRRASSHGLRLEYAEDVVVWHHAISTISGIINKSRRVVGGNVQLRRRTPYGLGDRLADVVREIADVRKRWRVFESVNPEAARTVRLKMACLIGVVQLARAVERSRVLAGGQPRRQ
jgi:glycosyltransferase involved in cell wall biosynthesis